jgi:hypothetical protein
MASGGYPTSDAGFRWFIVVKYCKMIKKEGTEREESYDRTW